MNEVMKQYIYYDHLEKEGGRRRRRRRRRRRWEGETRVEQE